MLFIILTHWMLETFKAVTHFIQPLAVHNLLSSMATTKLNKALLGGSPHPID